MVFNSVLYCDFIVLVLFLIQCYYCFRNGLTGQHSEWEKDIVPQHVQILGNCIQKTAHFSNSKKNTNTYVHIFRDY